MSKSPIVNNIPLISWIIPCYNESDVISETISRIKNVSSELIGSYTFEFIFIDDGSNDNTRDIIKSESLKDNRVKLIGLSRNFGHQVSLQAGINYARGEAVLLIDADLQDPPEVSLDMIRLWEEGYDVVYGKRTKRSSESRFKIITAKVFYKLLNYLSDITIPQDTGDFRLIDKKVVKALREMPERGRYMRGLISWCGFNQTYISYNRDPRFAGNTKYSLHKMISFALDGITSFSRIPLRIATYSGVFASLISLIGILYVLIIRLFTHSWVEGWTTLALAILFTSSVQLICLGILGEYIGRNYIESKSRPLYFLDELVGYDTNKFG